MSHRIGIIGAGSRRCGGAVLAGLFANPTPINELVLFDTHLEALDLFDRVARAFARESDSEPTIRCAESLDDAIKNKEYVILAVGLGQEAAIVESIYAEFARFELTQDTRELIRCLSLSPIFEEINETVYREAPGTKIINLTRPTRLTGKLLSVPAVHLDWPEILSHDAKVAAAHQALRWARSEDYAQIELAKHKQSPLIAAMTQWEMLSENRFDSRAAAGWIAALESVSQGLGARLRVR
jgi:hypothetical protein